MTIFVNFQKTTQTPFILFTYILAGVLTKYILINSGDFNYRHVFYNEEIYKLKNSSSIDLIGWFDFKLKLRQAIVNPPLRISIIIFITIIYSTNDIKLTNYLTIELLCYLIGFNVPQAIRAIKDSLATQPHLPSKTEVSHMEHWVQSENPIIHLSQDKLNRNDVIKRICDITNPHNEHYDTRGIAVIGTYGIGKSSIVYMALSELQMNNKNVIPCIIDAWGAYNSEEQIQKHIIEKIIMSLGQITSTTKLSGIPSKYIHSLKGAQSIWLDILPLFDNHSSPTSQLSEINNLLSDLNFKVFIVIEDLDRNKEPDILLNCIASFVDRLNGDNKDNYNNFRLILSIGETLHNPEVINRICRYKEFLHFNHDDVFDLTYNLVNELLCKYNFIYKGNIELFFKSDEAIHLNAREQLFSYISNPRDLKILLREFHYDWVHIFNGNCDILDALAITILKNHEIALIIAISKFEFSTGTDIDKVLSSFNFNDIKAAKIILNYFFIEKSIIGDERAQCCSSYLRQYINVLIEKKPLLYRGISLDKLYFSSAKAINKLSKKIELVKEVNRIVNIFDFMCQLKPRKKVISDLSKIFSKEALVPVFSSLFISINDGSKSDFNLDIIFRVFSEDISSGKIRTENINLRNKLIEKIATSLLPLSVRYTDTFYSELRKINITSQNDIFIPSISNILNAMKSQAYTKDNFYNRSTLYFTTNLLMQFHADGLSSFAKWIKDTKHKVGQDTTDFINNYKYGQFNSELDFAVLQISDLMDKDSQSESRDGIKL
ncbi:P-loop NTPase fold protein [Aeromonas hydrophila]